jgi:hypothetical protein
LRVAEASCTLFGAVVKPGEKRGDDVKPTKKAPSLAKRDGAFVFGRKGLGAGGFGGSAGGVFGRAGYFVLGVLGGAELS